MFPSERIEATPFAFGSGSTHICSLFGSDRNRTEKYEGRTQPECNIEHVYTDLLDTRYCGCEDDNVEMNNRIGDELKNVVTMEADSSSSPTPRNVYAEEEEFGCRSDRTDNDNTNSAELTELNQCAGQDSCSESQEDSRTGGVNSVSDNT